MSSTQPESPAETPDDVPRAAPDGAADAGTAATPSSTAATPSSEADPTPGTTDEHLLVDPARVRRAPRYRGFFTVGAVVGVVVGIWFGTWLADLSYENNIPMLKPGVFVSVVTLGVTTFFVLLAGALAIWADRRSLRKLRK